MKSLMDVTITKGMAQLLNSSFSPPLLQAFQSLTCLPVRKKEIAAHSCVEDIGLYARVGLPLQNRLRLESLRKLEVLVVSGHFSASALQML